MILYGFNTQIKQIKQYTTLQISFFKLVLLLLFIQIIYADEDM